MTVKFNVIIYSRSWHHAIQTILLLLTDMVMSKSPIWRAKQKIFVILGAEIFCLALQIELHSNELLGYLVTSLWMTNVTGPPPPPQKKRMPFVHLIVFLYRNKKLFIVRAHIWHWNPSSWCSWLINRWMLCWSSGFES